MEIRPQLTRMAEFVIERHDGQVRKSSGLPYFTHLFDVMTIVRDLGITDEDVLAACLGHDLKEDCGVTTGLLVGLFGGDVAYIIELLTKDDYAEIAVRPDRATRLEDMLKKIEESSNLGLKTQAKIIKMADRLSNIKHMPRDLWDYWQRERYCMEALIIADRFESAYPELANILSCKAKYELEKDEE